MDNRGINNCVIPFWQIILEYGDYMNNSVSRSYQIFLNIFLSGLIFSSAVFFGCVTSSAPLGNDASATGAAPASASVLQAENKKEDLPFILVMT